jgi:DNA-binding transcriptional ArsR family regulator
MNVKRLLWYLFAGSKGGDNRIKIIDLLKERPYNINQLAEALDLDYKAIKHHITVLEKITWLARWEKSTEYCILFLIILKSI